MICSTSTKNAKIMGLITKECMCLIKSILSMQSKLPWVKVSAKFYI